MYSSNNFIYETIDVIVRPAKTVYIMSHAEYPDASLTISGAAADAKVVGDKLKLLDNKQDAIGMVGFDRYV